MRRAITLLSVVFIYLVSLSAQTYGCRAPQPSALELVSESEFIVRATAIRYVVEPVGDIRALNTPDDAEIEFKIEEVLKGENLPERLTLHGYLTDRNDYNDRPVPYDFVRPNGRSGSCQAYEYKRGAEFLLFLKKEEGRFMLHPYGLAPTNEQLHGAKDEWPAWVREAVRSKNQ